MTLEESIKALEQEWLDKKKAGVPVDLDIFKRRKRMLVIGIEIREKRRNSNH